MESSSFWWCEKGNWHVVMKECYDAQFSLHEQHHCQISRLTDDDWHLQLCAKRLLWLGLKKKGRHQRGSQHFSLYSYLAYNNRRLFIHVLSQKSQVAHFMGEPRLLSNTFFHSHHIKESRWNHPSNQSNYPYQLSQDGRSTGILMNSAAIFLLYFLNL